MQEKKNEERSECGQGHANEHVLRYTMEADFP
jgi:hypothetical protein